MNDAFTEFEHAGWERVANKYDSTWSSSTRQFIPPLLDAAEVSEKMSILDVGCGPGYVSAAAAERGAVPIGLDFSEEMIVIAKKKFPRIEFRQGDAQTLPFPDASFDRIVANFALLHLAKPGPPHYLFESEEEFRKALVRAGFDGASMTFKVHRIEWNVPTARFIFDAELNAGVRTAGLLARQTPEVLRKIQAAIEKAVRPYAEGNGFPIPKAAYIVSISKK